MVDQPNRYRSYEPGIDGHEQDISDSNLRPRPYAFGRTAPQNNYHRHDEEVPLFLSDPDGDPDPSDFDYETDTPLRTRRRFSISSIILMTTVAASAVAVMLAWFSSDATRDMMVSAKASIANVLPVANAAPDAPAQPTQPAQPAQPTQQLTQRDVQLTPRDVQLKDPTRLSGPANQTPGANRNPQQQLAMLPSREDISNAYQAALNRAPPAAAPPPPPAAAAPQAATPPQAIMPPQASTPPQAVTPPLAAVAPVAVVPPTQPAPSAVPQVRRMDAGELAALMQRAKGFLATGDLMSARLLLERAADSQEVEAALMLAQTYDPDVLGAADVRNIIAEPAKARAWYQKAAQLGSSDAQRRLAQLPN
jgi:hypothetical protein